MDESELPGYASASLPAPKVLHTVEHVYSLESKGHKWISLFVQSHAKSPASLPVFLQNDIISGHVELDLEKEETVKGVTIAVQAGTTSIGQEEELFLNIEEALWGPVSGGGKSSSKLKGQYSWPFEFMLPIEVPISSKGTFRLPPNFSERASPAYIDYRLIVTVKRGMLRVNQSLSTNFGYIPLSMPDPPSSLRQLAYSKKGSLTGPDGDPEGWKVLAPIKIKGTLFNAREAEVECTLSIATPLCYAAGSPLPLWLFLTSEDSQALDLLAAPSAIGLHLVRSIATGSDASGANEIRRSNNFFLEGVGQAFFWPLGGSANTRVLQGELEIPANLKPSFDFPRLTVRYTLDLLPFEALGFVTPHAGSGTTLVSERVAIATKQTPGVVPQSHAPPGYERPPGGDYNKSVGLLENGNQRFYRHGH